MGCLTNCSRISNRYAIAFLSFLGLLILIGYRTCFALVVTYIAKFNSTSGGSTHANDSSSDSLFPHCTTYNTSRDRQVDWSESTTFLFHAAYFAGQVVASLPGAFLVSGSSSKWLFGSTVLSSGVLFLILPKASEGSDVAVYVIRALQGVIEAIAIPAVNAFISLVASKTERARLINIAFAGVYFSPAVAMLTTGATTCYVSWDAMIYIYGAMGALWGVVWLLIVEKHPVPQARVIETRHLLHAQEGPAETNHSPRPVPWFKMFTSLPMIAIWVANFCRNFVFAMLFTQVQQYYKDVYQLSTAMIGLLSAIPYVFLPLAMMPISYGFDLMVESRSYSLTKIRKLAQLIGDSVSSACYLALGFINNHILAFVLLCVGVTFSAFSMSGFQTNPLDIAPQHAGALSGIIRSSIVGSICCEILASQITDNSHSLIDWQHMFIIAGSINLGGLLFYTVFASGDVQSWAMDTEIDAINEDRVDNSSRTNRGCIDQALPGDVVFDHNGRNA